MQSFISKEGQPNFQISPFATETPRVEPQTGPVAVRRAVVVQAQVMAGPVKPQVKQQQYRIQDQEVVEEVATSFTIEGDVETFNATAVRLYLSELYGVPLSWIVLNTTSGSSVVKMVIRRPVGIADAPAARLAAVLQRVQNASTESLLAEALGVNVSQAVAPAGAGGRGEVKQRV